MQQIPIYFKSDFKLFIRTEAGFAVPFKFEFYTNAPSRPFVAKFDGYKYYNCSLMEDGRLCVAFDDHNMGMGKLMIKQSYYLNDTDYKSEICDRVIAPQPVINIDDHEMRSEIVLSSNGDDTIEFTSQLPPYYQAGLTPEEHQALIDATAHAEAAAGQAEGAASNADKAREELTTAYNARVAALQQDYDTTKANLASEYSGRLAALQADYNATKNNLSNDYAATKSALDANYNATKNALAADYAAKKSALDADYAATIANLNNAYATAIAEVDARMTAIESDYASDKDKWNTAVAALLMKFISDFNTAEAEREARVSQAIADAEGATGAANTAAGAANTAATHAGNVNAVLNGDELTVTDKNGQSVTRNVRGPKGDSITMFPNVTIFGQPIIQESQISGFTANDYVQFPFVVDFAGRPWQIDCAITTGADVSQQHNVFDSAFGLAFAFSGGKFVLAMSSNGTSWNLGATSGTHNILANTTYYIRISWDGTTYKLAYSTDKETWIDDIVVVSSESLAPKQIVIGKDLANQHIFNGSINMADAHLTISGKIVWEGMDDAGLATRMAIDMSNIDSEGIARLNEIIKAAGLGSLLDIMGLYSEREPMIFEAAQSGKAIVPLYEGSRFGKVETYAGAVVSKEYQVTQGDILKFKSGKTTNSIFTVSQVTTNSNGTKTYTKVMSLNELAEVPMDGYLRFLVMPSDMTIVITYFPTEPNFESTIHVYRCGAFASISAQLGNLWATLLEDYMRKDGYSAGARVGNADNLTPRGEASAETFVSRIAGGANQIEDGDARIVRVKGKTLKVAQMVAGNSSYVGGGVTYTRNSNGTYTTQGTATSYSVFPVMPQTNSLTNGHKYFVVGCPLGGSESTYRLRFTSGSISEIGGGLIFTSNGTQKDLSISVFEGVNVDGFVWNPRLLDLTEMGMDHCTTADQVAQEFGFDTWDAFAAHPSFEQMMAYSETQRLVNSHVEGVRTTGRNLIPSFIDGKTVLDNTGKESTASAWWCTPFIKVSPNTTYYALNVVSNIQGYGVFYYDVDNNLIDAKTFAGSGDVGRGEFTTPSNCAYIRAKGMLNPGHDETIINLSDPAFNGQYEPYETHERKWTETIRKCFPDGMKSAKVIFDEFTPTKATARMKKARLADFSWAYYNGRFFAQIADSKRVTTYPYGENTNAVCSLYPIDSSTSSNQNDKTIRVNQSNDTSGYMYIRNTDYTDVPSFVAHLGDAELVYELAEPIVTEYDELNLSERVAVGGMEEAIVPEGVESAPLSADIIYPIDAYNTIKSNKQRIETLEQKPAISLTADEVTKLRALINVSTQSEV